LLARNSTNFITKAILAAELRDAGDGVPQYAAPDVAMDVQVFPLVPNAILPQPAPASTRDRVPSGFGVSEECLPFTAANALGLLVLSPIDFGFCAPDDVPAGAHAFRPPVDPLGHGDSRVFSDSRVFYVKDSPTCRFVRNSYAFEPRPLLDLNGNPGEVIAAKLSATKPGVSFFDRPDQQSLFKLHLPYILRTPSEVDSLFITAVNRAMPLTLLAGLVETDWYTHPVELIARKPPSGMLHVAAGDVVAQILLIPRMARCAKIHVVAAESNDATARGDWLKLSTGHAEDLDTYKRLARSRHGRIKMPR
jgi:hypothetical protein